MHFTIYNISDEHHISDCYVKLIVHSLFNKRNNDAVFIRPMTQQSFNHCPARNPPHSLYSVIQVTLDFI